MSSIFVILKFKHAHLKFTVYGRKQAHTSANAVTLVRGSPQLNLCEEHTTYLHLWMSCRNVISSYLHHLPIPQVNAYWYSQLKHQKLRVSTCTCTCSAQINASTIFVEVWSKFTCLGLANWPALSFHHVPFYPNKASVVASEKAVLCKWADRPIVLLSNLWSIHCLQYEIFASFVLQAMNTDEATDCPVPVNLARSSIINMYVSSVKRQTVKWTYILHHTGIFHGGQSQNYRTVKTWGWVLAWKWVLVWAIW